MERPPFLTDEYLAKCQALIKMCAETGQYLHQCTACQLDVDRQHGDNTEQLRIASGIKKTFFPDVP